MTKNNLSCFTRLSMLIAFASCCWVTSVQAQEQPQNPWQMSDAEKSEWLQTLKVLLPDGTWKIINEGNEFFIQCPQPVKFYYFTPGVPASKERPTTPAEADFRVTLRFSPLLSKTQWKEKKASNEAVETKHRALLRKFKINQRYDQFSLSGNDAQQRADSYRAEVADLKHELLPQFFGLDSSVTVFQSWHYLFLIDTNGPQEVGADCEEFLNRIRRLFGTYESRYAQNSWFAYAEKNRITPLYPEKLTINGRKD